MKKLLIIVSVLATLLPTPAYACSGFVDCLFGWSERTEIKSSRDIEIERIQAERDQQIADIEAMANERIRAAEIEVERVKQQQFASEHERDIAIARIEKEASDYRSMIDALTQEKIAGINANAQMQLATLQHTTELGLASITEAGRTERFRVSWGWIFAIVATLIIGRLVYSQQQMNRQRWIESNTIDGYIDHRGHNVIIARKREIQHYE